MNQVSLSNQRLIQELIKIQENAISFNKIDKSKYDLKNLSFQEQIGAVRNYFDCLYYDNIINNYNLNSGINNLLIDCRSMSMNCVGFGTGNEDRLKKENLIKPNNQLIEGNTIYDLKIKGETIKDVSIIILGDKEYSIKFENINDQWILPFFTKTKPFLLSAIPWNKFYIKIITDKACNVNYSYSLSIFSHEINNKIVMNNWKMDKIEYKFGSVIINQ